MTSVARLTPDLELALMRRGLMAVSAGCERCGRCRRSLLVGERVYVYESGAARCALCREREHARPAHSHTVHGPEFGHSLRVIDQRAAA
jgi:hypothetical protein